jgi:hypothetical protein
LGENERKKRVKYRKETYIERGDLFHSTPKPGDK